MRSSCRSQKDHPLKLILHTFDSIVIKMVTLYLFKKEPLAKRKKKRKKKTIRET